MKIGWRLDGNAKKVAGIAGLALLTAAGVVIGAKALDKTMGKTFANMKIFEGPKRPIGIDRV